MKNLTAKFLLLASVTAPLILPASVAAVVSAPKKIRFQNGVFRCRSADLASVVTFGQDVSIPKEGYRLEVTPEPVCAWSSGVAGDARFCRFSKRMEARGGKGELRAAARQTIRKRGCHDQEYRAGRKV